MFVRRSDMTRMSRESFRKSCRVQYVPVVVYIYKERDKKKIKLYRQTKKTKSNFY